MSALTCEELPYKNGMSFNCQWFVYDIIKKFSFSSDQFAPDFDRACKTIHRVSLANLKLFGRMKTEFGAKEVGEFFIMLYGGNGPMDILFS